MTEQKWLGWDDPQQLLDFVQGQIHNRKLWLLACACCRRIWEHFADERSRRAVEMSEKYADGLVGTEEQRAVAFDAARAMIEADSACESARAKISAEKWIAQLAGRLPRLQTLEENAAEAARRQRAAEVAKHVAEIGSPSMVAAVREPSWYFLHLTAALGLVQNVTSDPQGGITQANLVRHVVGNPFRPYLAPDAWPVGVVQLAEAMYNGQDCGFALHDALLEAGHADLAAHFRTEKWHPKGCWALDLLLEKE